MVFEKFRKQENSLHLILSRSVKQKKQTKESPGWCVWAMIPNETYLTLYKWLAEAYQCQRLCKGKTKYAPIHDIPDQNSLILPNLPPHLKGVRRFVENGLPFRCRDRLELTLVFEARNLNLVIEKMVRSGIWRNLRRRKLHLARTAYGNRSRESPSLSVERNSWRNWIRHPTTKKVFSHQEMDSLPLWSMQHAIMTLNILSGVEIMTAETLTMSR